MVEKSRKKISSSAALFCRVKKKGSNNRNKARLQVARIHEKIANQRNDFSSQDKQ